MDHFLYNVPRLLVGTKSDLRNNTERINELRTDGRQLITVEQVNNNTCFIGVNTYLLKAEQLATRLNTQYIECSARLNQNIAKVIQTAANLAVASRRSGLRSNRCSIL